MKILSKKEIEIIILLLKEDEYINAQMISNILGFSLRSVKSYIKNINITFENSILSSQHGYKINHKDLFTDYLSNQLKDIPPQTKNDRMIILFKELLIHNETFLIEDLAEKLCISSDTLFREVRQLNQNINPYQLNVIFNKEMIYIEGTEDNKRSAISNFILNDIKESIFNVNALEKYYPHYQIEKIQRIISNALKQNEYFLDDFSIFNLLLHIIIVIDRNKKNHIKQREALDNIDNIVPLHVINISTSICNEVQKEIDVIFFKNDIYDFSLLLSTRLTKQKEEISSFDILKNTNTEVFQLLRDIEDKLKDTYNLHFSNDSLRLRFYVHIKNVILRITHDIKIMNPMLNEMRNHIYIYDVAIFIARMIAKEYKTHLSEDEVAYIAMHLIFSFQEEIIQRKQLSTLLICPNYGDARKLAMDSIQTIFKNDIYISEVQGQFPKVIDNKFDIILSTMTTTFVLPYEYVQINLSLTNKDILNISKLIEDVKDTQKRNKFKNELQYFFKKEFLYVNREKHMQMNDIIEFVSNDLTINNYVPPIFKKRLFEREELYSSAYNNIAIPHPLDHIALKSTIAIYICPQGITWNKKTNVNIVFTLALTKEDQILFKNLFNFISELLVNQQALNQLLKVYTYEEFIDKLIELCDF